MRLLPADPVRRGRIKLLLLAAFFALPSLGAWLAYELDWAPGTTANYGELLAPAGVPDATLQRVDRGVLKLSELRGKWVLVQLDRPACDAYCAKKLYYMRQVRRALGRDMERIERLWILTEAGAPSAELAAAYQGTIVGRSTGRGLEAAFPAARAAADHVYLIDPLGNVMMRFPRDPDPSLMIKDLKRLLKYSRVG